MTGPSFSDHFRSRPFEILLVEDSPTDVLLATEALGGTNILSNLNIVRDGVEATSFLQRRDAYADAPRPELILLDLNLPKKDGREVLAEIKDDEALKEIPVIVLTTSQADEDIAMSYAHHANCYITKPLDLQRFTHVIRRVVAFWLAIGRRPGTKTTE